MKYDGVDDALVEKIARDVRAWDASRTPEVVAAQALGNVSDRLAEGYDAWLNANERREQREETALRLDVIRTVTHVLELHQSPEMEKFRDSAEVKSLLAEFISEERS